MTTEEIWVVAYEGTYYARAQDLFEADATKAAEHGWYPMDQTRSGSQLAVSYACRMRSAPDRTIQGADGGRRTRPS